jgi:hypothetical protein
MEHRNTLVFLNQFIMQTTKFLNRFASVCEDVSYHNLTICHGFTETTGLIQKNSKVGCFIEYTRVKIAVN